MKREGTFIPYDSVVAFRRATELRSPGRVARQPAGFTRANLRYVGVFRGATSALPGIFARQTPTTTDHKEPIYAQPQPKLGKFFIFAL